MALLKGARGPGEGNNQRGGGGNHRGSGGQLRARGGVNKGGDTRSSSRGRGGGSGRGRGGELSAIYCRIVVSYARHCHDLEPGCHAAIRTVTITMK